MWRRKLIKCCALILIMTIGAFQAELRGESRTEGSDAGLVNKAEEKGAGEITGREREPDKRGLEADTYYDEGGIIEEDFPEEERAEEDTGGRSVKDAVPQKEKR